MKCVAEQAAQEGLANPLRTLASLLTRALSTLSNRNRQPLSQHAVDDKQVTSLNE